MARYFPCRNCGGTMVGQFCSDCGFDELQFCREWDDFVATTEVAFDEDVCWEIEREAA